MKYELKSATKKDSSVIITYKLDSILKYVDELSKKEIDKIKKYVDDTIKDQIKDYKLIIINNDIKGCYFITKKDDGILLDEIYIDKQYRNKGIGTDIIKQLLLKNNIIYLWVYKLNINAYNLYLKLDFKIIDETQTRYYMKYSKQDT